MSHPTWVRGLKRIKYEDVYDDRFVAPYVGAWIETIHRLTSRSNTCVAPYVGAWIETRRVLAFDQNNPVAPYVGAWIETSALEQLNVAPESHPTWVRGLKLFKFYFNRWQRSVAPYVGAWIETNDRRYIRPSR